MSQYLAEINSVQFLTNNEEYELAVSTLKGNEIAREKLISSHLKLVISIAKKYNGNNVDFDDLIQEGNVGLISAVDNFNPEKGVRLSIYAKQWVEEFIKRRVYKDIFSANVPFKVAKKLMKSKDEQTKLVVASLKNPIRLNASKNDGSEVTYDDMIKDHRALPEEIADSKELKSMINTKVKYILEERELGIIQERVLCKKKKTYKEIGEKMNLSLETIRLVEKKSLSKIKNELQDILKSYL